MKKYIKIEDHNKKLNAISDVLKTIAYDLPAKCPIEGSYCACSGQCKSQAYWDIMTLIDDISINKD